MEHWLEHIVEPSRLILAWQAPIRGAEGRYRWAVGELLRDKADVQLRYFDRGAAFSQANQGKPYEAIARVGYSGHPAFRLKSQRHHDGVIEAFRRRLPARSRADFPAYIKHYRIRADADVSDFALLGITEAKLPNDGFSLVDPLDHRSDACDLMLEVAGFRHDGPQFGRGLHVGEPLQLVAEPDNQQDPNAIAVMLDRKRVGYVNRLQAGAFANWLATHAVEAWIERLNGKPDHPRMHMFVQLRRHMKAAA